MKPAIAALLLFTGCAANPAADSVLLRVLSYNIKHGHGNDGNVDLSRAAEVIRRVDPDLVVLQEIDNGVRRSGGQDQMTFLAERTGLHARFGGFMAYQGGHYGMGVMSRFPILACHNHELPDGAEPRTALDVHVRLPNGIELVLCGVHLYATADERKAQARRLVAIYEDATAPMILGGDFNSKPGSPVMDLIERHWTNPPKGDDPLTFPSDGPRSEIDFLLFRPAERFSVVSVDVLDEPVISDHRPVLIELELLPTDQTER